MWKNIIDRLIEHGMTQSEISDKTGISQPSISDLATGKTKTGPRGDRAIKLYDLYTKVVLGKPARRKAA